MRKLRRSVIRHQAEKAEGKTIKVFHYLWKQFKAQKGRIAVNGGKQIKQRSILNRTVRKVVAG